MADMTTLYVAIVFRRINKTQLRTCTSQVSSVKQKHMLAHERLRAWLDANQLTYRAAATRLGVSAATICNWTNGKWRPEWPARRRLAKATRGAVPVAAWGDQ